MEVLSFSIITDKRMVRVGYSEINGNIMYAGPSFNAWKSNNCPPAPSNPTAEPRIIERLSVSIFHLTRYKATSAQGIIVSDQTIYPSVGGKPAFCGTSIKAPHTPQNTVVIMAYDNQARESFMVFNKYEDKYKKKSY